MALRLQNENTLHDRTATKSRHTAAEKATSQGKLLVVCDENVGKPVQRSSEELEACEQPIPNRVERPRTQNEIGPDNPPPPPNVEDIDADDSEYLEFCSDYVKHIYDHLFKNEALSPVEVDFLKKYPELSPRMRKMLIEWLVSLQSRFRLLQDTLMLSVSIMDRTLTAHRFKVNRANFQLLGATCLWIASKYEEMYCPSVRDFVYMCADSYTCLEFREMETRILTTLGFEFSKPISSHFLRRFSKAGGGEFKTHTAAKYLIELSLYSYELAHCLPSLIAASALFVAGRATGVIVWDETMEFYSRYRSKTLKPVALKMAQIAAGVQKDAHLKTTLQKYSCEKFYMVPTLFTAKLLDELFPSGGTA